jgi:transglycosylase-like protein with SLT domain
MADQQSVPINPSLLLPDVSVLQQQIAQQMALSNAMRQQSLEVPQTQAAAGWILPMWGQELGNLAKGYVAGQIQKKLPEEIRQLSAAYQTGMGGLLNALVGGPAPAATTTAPTAPSAGADQTAATPPADQVSPATRAAFAGQTVPMGPEVTPPEQRPGAGLPITVQAAAATPPTAGPLVVSSAMAGATPELRRQIAAGFMIDPTGTVKTLLEKRIPAVQNIEALLDAAGIRDPALRSQIIQGQIAKELNINVRPGGTVLNLATGKPTYIAPQLEKSAIPLFDQQGNIVAQRLLGGTGQAIAQAAEAQAVGQAGGAVKQIWDPQRGVYVYPTLKQVIEQATGAPQPVSPGGPTVSPGQATAPLMDAIRQTEVANLPVDQQVSPKGAMGPYQIIPSTAARLQKQYGPFNAFDENQARGAATWEMNRLYQKYGSWQWAAAAYNAGEGAVDAAKGDFSKLPAETQKYVKNLGPVISSISAPAAAPQAPGAPPTGAPPTPAGPAMAEPPIGTAEMGKGAAQVANKHFEALQDAASDARSRANVYDNVIRYSQQVSTGAPMQAIYDAKAWATNMGLTGWKTDIEAYQLIKKFVEQGIAQQHAGLGGTGTDKQLENTILASPNMQMLGPALRDAAQYLKSREYALLAKEQQLEPFITSSDWRGYLNARTAWDRDYDPRAWQIASAPDAATASKLWDHYGLTESDRKILEPKLNAALQFIRGL